MQADDSRSFLDNIPIGVYRLDAEDRIVYANDAWLELHGYDSADKVLGKAIRSLLVRPQEAEKLKKELEEAGASVELK